MTASSKPELTASETAALVRAAIGYAGVELDELALRTGIKASTLRNWTSRARPVKAPLEKRRVIAANCGVPLDFMETGFVSRSTDVEALQAALAALESRVNKMQAQLTVLEAEARQRSAASSKTIRRLPQRGQRS